MQKCDHGVYIGKNDRRALYCSHCTPAGSVKNTREVVLPVSGVGNPAKLRANGGNAGECCPKCFSEVYVLKNERSRVVECADCGAEYRRKNLK
jgi:hypothetical protein